MFFPVLDSAVPRNIIVEPEILRGNLHNYITIPIGVYKGYRMEMPVGGQFKVMFPPIDTTILPVNYERNIWVFEILMNNLEVLEVLEPFVTGGYLVIIRIFDSTLYDDLLNSRHTKPFIVP